MKEDVLDYIGLELEKVPKKLLKSTEIHFSNYNNSNSYKVYDYIFVKDLEVFITPLDRTSDLKERIKKAKSLAEYLKTDDKDMKKLFENILSLASVKEIKELENIQEKLNKELPYFVKYDKNYLWQIYYSKEDNKYFMIFPASEGETSVLFYIIKKKLERKDSKIFVPISKMDYSGNILGASEINDIENYIWLFTNEWPDIYEVSGEKLYITGHTKINKTFESNYRNIYTSKESAKEFYTLLKAMFVLTTETNYKYMFSPYINENGELQLKYGSQIINMDNFPKFIDEQTELQSKRKKEIEYEIEQNEKILSELKEYVKRQNEIYVTQEKQIVMFLECKKSFFKKISYFFKSKKFTTPKIDVKIDESTNVKEFEMEEEGSYTIKELINTLNEVNLVDSKARDLREDIRALKLKKENLERKIKNATSYIQEIDKHKKSIFEFWKFSNKDALPSLEEGEKKEEEKSRISRAFDIENDIEVFGCEVDRIQRKKLSKVECDAIYIAKDYINEINSIENSSLLESKLDEIKESIEKKKTTVLGNMLEDYMNRKTINNKEHRENQKENLKILKIDKSTTVEEFGNNLRENKNLLQEAYNKIKQIAKVDVYISKPSKENEFVIGDLKPEKLIEANKKSTKLYKIQLEEGENALYFTNIIFFDNYNKTLPLGMDISTKVLLKMPRSEEKNKEKINILIKKDDFTVNIKNVTIVTI